MNTSFDAYLMADRPAMSPRSQKLTMTRDFELDDDLKEYWGFYLLKGSEVTVSSCARYANNKIILLRKTTVHNMNTLPYFVLKIPWCQRDVNKRNQQFEILCVCWTRIK